MGTGNIIDFVPGKSKIQKRLQNLQEAMNSVYQNLDECYAMVEQIEAEAAKLEEAYNHVLVEYAESVGMDKVEPDYLEYSTALRQIVMKDGTIRFAFLFPCGFTIESDEP